MLSLENTVLANVQSCTREFYNVHVFTELKIKELEETIREQRKLRDAVDELDLMKQLNDKLNQDLLRSGLI
jgi:cell shape-determining protein MreC